MSAAGGSEASVNRIEKNASNSDFNGWFRYFKDAKNIFVNLCLTNC